MLNRKLEIEKILARIVEINTAYDQYSTPILELPEHMQADLSSIVGAETAAKPELIAYWEGRKLSALEQENNNHALLAAACVNSILMALSQAYLHLNLFLQDQTEKLGVEKVIAKEVAEYYRHNIIFKKLCIDVDRVCESFIAKYANKDEAIKASELRGKFSNSLWKLEQVRMVFLNNLARREEFRRELLFSLLANDNNDIEGFLLAMGEVVTKDEINVFLRHAADKGQVENLKQLISHGDVLSTQTLSGRTVLHLASKNGHVGCVRVLLEKPSSKFDYLIGKKDKFGKSFEDNIAEIKDETIRSEMQLILASYKQRSASLPDSLFYKSSINGGNSFSVNASVIQLKFIWRGKYSEHSPHKPGSAGYEYLRAITLSLANGRKHSLYLDSVREDDKFKAVTNCELPLEVSISYKENPTVLVFSSLEELRQVKVGLLMLESVVTNWDEARMRLITPAVYYTHHYESDIKYDLDLTNVELGKCYNVIISQNESSPTLTVQVKPASINLVAQSAESVSSSSATLFGGSNAEIVKIPNKIPAIEGLAKR